MHDLLRDLALREGEKEKFLYVWKEQSSDDREISRGTISSTQRRILTSLKEYPPNPLIESEKPTTSSLVRSFIGKFPPTFSMSNFRLLRVCMDLEYFEVSSHSFEKESSDKKIFIRLANLRHIWVDVELHPLHSIPSWASSLWNLQTICLFRACEKYVLDIWKMPLLRHVFTDECKITPSLSDPPLSGDDMDELVLQNLHTLGRVKNLILSKNVIKRIPNINTLILKCDKTSNRRVKSGEDISLNNLCRLHKLQLLQIETVHQLTLTFPYSLKELILKGTRLPWEEMETKIGCLPLLQVLILERHSFTGSEWETVQGQFPSLKFLLIKDCPDLEYWMTDNTHFPRLEHLILHQLTKLREIPSSIGDIPTLRSIKLMECCDSAKESAQIIREEQEEYNNELLQIQVD